MSRVVIVGASVAGIRTVQALRQQGFDGQITLVGEELEHPYDKPPLSKEHLTSGEPTPLLTTEELDQLDIDLHLGIRATGVDTTARVLRTSGGDLPFDHLVIATGVTPRILPGSNLPGVRTVRTANDATWLHEQLADTPRVVVIGAGFIGAEFAVAASARGCEVTIVEAQTVPMAHLLGDRVGERLARLHTDHGVNVRTSARFDHFVGTDHVEGVALEGGEVLPADLVVVGIGATPATGWLAGSGLPVDDGLECDADLRVVGYPQVLAAGDVAQWPHPHYGERLRIEHWTNANEHAALVAATITGGPSPRAQVPYVWSDQYGHRIQIAGLPARGQLVRLGGEGPGDLVAVYADETGAVVGGVVVDDVRTFMKLRKAVTKQTPAADLAPPLAPATVPA